MSDATPPSDAAAGAAGGDRPAVDSRWWYWIAATPLYLAASVLVGAWAFAAVVLGVTLVPDSPEVVLGLGVFTLLAFAAFALLGVVVLVAFPVALYLDSEAVNDADLEWQPDSVLYALVGAVTAFTSAFALSVVVAAYYLYQRHRHVGVP